MEHDDSYNITVRDILANKYMVEDSVIVFCLYEEYDPWMKIYMLRPIIAALQSRCKNDIEKMLSQIRFIEFHDELAERLIQESREYYEKTGKDSHNIQFSPVWFDATNHEVLSQARNPFLEQRFGIKGLIS